MTGHLICCIALVLHVWTANVTKVSPRQQFLATSHTTTKNKIVIKNLEKNMAQYPPPPKKKKKQKKQKKHLKVKKNYTDYIKKIWPKQIELPVHFCLICAATKISRINHSYEQCFFCTLIGTCQKLAVEKGGGIGGRLIFFSAIEKGRVRKNRPDLSIYLIQI